jgi:hemerythrin superfamily protein
MAENIFDVLKKDHNKVKGLFRQIARKKQSPESVFPQIRQELEMHFQGEEKLLYPYLRDKAETHDITMESIEEHSVTKKELSEIVNLSTTDEWFAPKIKVLQELVNHHIEEEETQLFKKAKKVMNKQDAEEMVRRFDEEKQRMMTASAGGSSPAAQSKQSGRAR